MNILNRVVGGNLTRNQDFWSKTRFEVMKIEIHPNIVSMFLLPKVNSTMLNRLPTFLGTYDHPIREKIAFEIWILITRKNTDTLWKNNRILIRRSIRATNNIQRLQAQLTNTGMSSKIKNSRVGPIKTSVDESFFYCYYSTDWNLPSGLDGSWLNDQIQVRTWS